MSSPDRTVVTFAHSDESASPPAANLPATSIFKAKEYTQLLVREAKLQFVRQAQAKARADAAAMRYKGKPQIQPRKAVVRDSPVTEMLRAKAHEQQVRRLQDAEDVRTQHAHAVAWQQQQLENEREAIRQRRLQTDIASSTSNTGRKVLSVRVLDMDSELLVVAQLDTSPPPSPSAQLHPPHTAAPRQAFINRGSVSPASPTIGPVLIGSRMMFSPTEAQLQQRSGARSAALSPRVPPAPPPSRPSTVATTATRTWTMRQATAD